jgi:hypothetical protein
MSIYAPGRKLFIDENLVPLNLDYTGFQETKKEDFTNSFLKQLLGNRNFVHLRAIDTAGGILVGVNADLLEILS